MDRLSTLDAEFLHLEDDVAHMVIAGVCVFDDPPPTLDEFQQLIESKLHQIPRYRQRIRAVPFELGRPVWVDDPHFRLSYHVRHSALPSPGNDAGLARLMGRLMSQPLDHGRPLWEATLVEGLAGNRWALIFKLHHCMVDGVAGVELLSVLLDIEPHTSVAVPEPWEPAPEPAGAALVLDAWGGLASDVFGWAQKLPGALVHPVGAVRGLAATGEGLLRFVRNLSMTPRLSIEGPISPHRVWASSSVSLGDVRTIRSVFGGTINDVVLAAVSGGYRELLRTRGEDPDHAVVRSLVPVSMRTNEGAGDAANRVSALLLELPVHIADPVARLAAVHEAMIDLKGSHMAEAGEVVAAVGNLFPPMLIGAATRLAMLVEHRRAQRVINTVTTNVPGPQFPLYCLGREMIEYRPYVPISPGLRVGTAILSYNGHLFFGITGDYDTATDVSVVADATAATIHELRDRALIPSSSTSRAKRTSKPTSTSKPTTKPRSKPASKPKPSGSRHRDR